MPAFEKRMWHVLTRQRLLDRLLERFERLPPRRPNLLRVLVYHRVDAPQARPELDPALLSATPDAFEEQVAFLAEHYRVVGMAEVLEACRRQARLPPRAVLITFDDAYQDFAEHAWPTLRRHALPATLFVPTAFPDRPDRIFWWDRLYRAWPPGESLDALKRLKARLKKLPHAQAMELVDQLCRQFQGPAAPNAVLGWNALRRLAGEGVTIAPHTQNHPVLTRVTRAQAAREVCGALEELACRIGSVLPVMAYPDGQSSRSLARRLERLGVRVALGVARGINDLDRADPLLLRRIPVGARTNLAGLRLQLLPWL